MPTRTQQELFCKDLIASYINSPRFVERDWLWQRVQAAFEQPHCRLVLLTAEPGAGKTAFMAWMADRHANWPRYFIRRDSQIPLNSGDARSFLFALGHQLATLQPSLFPTDHVEVTVIQRADNLAAGGSVTGARIRELLASPFRQTAVRIEQHTGLVAGALVGLTVDRMVTEPRLLNIDNLSYLALFHPGERLQQIDPDARIVILVDALDELHSRVGRQTILDWLTGCPELPPNVRFVLASRPDEALLSHFRERQKPWLRELEINRETALVHTDLRRYAEGYTSTSDVADALQECQVSREVFIDRAVTAATGNFQYLSALFRAVGQAIERQDTAQLNRLLALRELPDRLEALYAYFLRQLRAKVAGEHVEVRTDEPLQMAYLPAWEGLYQPILGVLAVACTVLTPEEISHFAQLRTEMRWLFGGVAQLSQFLDREDGHLRLYHATLPEFLISDETRHTAPDCYLEQREWHRKITGYYLARYTGQWEQCDAYGLEHLLEHVVAARLDEKTRSEVLDAVLTDAFVEAVRIRFGWIFRFIEDLYVVAEVDPGRAAAQCLKILEGPRPNSLVMQWALRLLVKVRPIVGTIGNPRSSRHRAIDQAIQILIKRPEDIDEQLKALLRRTKNPRIKSIIALAMGETGSREVAGDLLTMFKTGRRGRSWAAADALIALNDPAVIPELIQWYEQSKNAYDRERVLYILGWMHADEARVLVSQALVASAARVVGRGVDLLWQLQPATGDGEVLLERLQHILRSDPLQPKRLGPWGNEWVQKRLVRALSRTRVAAAYPLLQRLQDHIAARGKPAKPVERDELNKSIREALIALGPLSKEKGDTHEMS